jgi:subtilisin family serine protease
LISLKVLDGNGEGYWSGIISALDHVAKFGLRGDVVIISLGSFNIANCENSNVQLKEAIENVARLGIFVIMSAGNDSGDAMLNSPGCISGPNIFTVGSIDSNCENGVLGCSSFSNFGSNVDWVAPGNPMFSTSPGNQYMMMSGTSMANALVAGIIFASNGSPAILQSINCNGRTYSIPKVR